MQTSVLGLDIGGANLKAAHTNGTARLHPFELWKTPNDLPDTTRDLLKIMPRSDLLAVTMTGELCDCFENKRQGVPAILDAAKLAAGDTPIRVWTISGSFKELEEAKADFLSTAAANWLALAFYAGRLAPRGSALLIDIGSTTTDIVPLLDGRPIPRGRTDPERLACRELVYTGIRRTPVCALLGGDGAAEFFATTQDVYLLLGEMPSDANDRRTADGRPATVEAAHARLARMICADSETCLPQVTMNLAQEVADRQQTLLRNAVTQVSAQLPSLPRTIVISGSGEFLARQLVTDVEIISLAEKLNPDLSSAACAYAVAVLAQEMLSR
jgi:(4-(4-[2-(gamma-L-glutamylamino)ethyl]phenoxymethyl)furan-2-yl)methanamine synthase